MKLKRTNKLLALLLTLVMVVGMLPAFALPAAATTSISCYFAADNPSMTGAEYSTYTFDAFMPIRAVDVTWFSLTALAEAAGVTPTFAETENQITAAHVAVQAVRDQVKNQDINPFDAQYADYISMNAEGKIVSLLGNPLAIDETLIAKTLSPVVYWSLNSTSYGATSNQYNPTLVPAVDGELMLLTRRFVNSNADGLVVYVNHFDSYKKYADATKSVSLVHSQYKSSGVQTQPWNCNDYKHKIYWLNESGVFEDVTEKGYCNIPENGTPTKPYNSAPAWQNITFEFKFLIDGIYAIYSYNNKGIAYNAVGSWCLVNCNVAEETIDDEKLANLQTLVTTIGNGYYQENDRWNGTYCENGFWATYMENAYRVACDVLLNPLSNQSITDSINALSAVDTSKLISKSNLNTTELYETLKRMDRNFPDSELNGYTPASVALFKEARTAEWTYLNSLFDETTHAPTSANSSANETTYLEHLSTATNLYKILVDLATVPQSQAMIDGLPALVSAFSASGVRDASATEAYAAAQALVTSAGSTLPDAETASGLVIKEWTDAYAELQAAAWGIPPTESITVTLRVADNYGMRWAGKGLGAEKAVIDQSYTLTAANATLTGLLTAAGLLDPSVTYLREIDEVGNGNADIGQSYSAILLINGVNVSVTNELTSALGSVTTSSLNPTNAAALSSVCLHDNDEVVLLAYAMSSKPEFSYGVSIGPLDYGHDLALLDVTGPSSTLTDGVYGAKTGEAMTVTVTETGAWLPLYTGTPAVAEGVEVMVSGVCETKAAAQAATPTTARIKNPNSTPSGWKVVYTMSTSPYYDPDWQQGNAVLTDANGQADIVFLQQGWYKVAVMDTRDADRNQALGSTGVYYSTKAGDYILVQVEAGPIEAVKAQYLATAQTYFEGFHDYDFPEGYYAGTFQPQYTALVANVQSAADETALKDQFDTDFALLKQYGATAYDHQGQVDAVRRILRYMPDDTSKLDSGCAAALTELQTQYAAMSEHAKTLLTEAERTKLAALAAVDVTKLPQLPAVTVTITTEGELPLKSDGGAATYGTPNAAWSVTPGLDGMVGDPDWTTLANPATLSVHGGDRVFIRRYLEPTDTLYRLMWTDGDMAWTSAEAQPITVSEWNVTYDGYWVVEYLVPKDAADGSTVNLQLTMWSRAAYDGDGLADTKAAALAAVQAAYDGYDLTKYDAAGQAALAKALSDGKAAIEAATGNEAVTAARKAAVAAMSMVATKTQSGGQTNNTSFDYGDPVGRVHVLIENTTYAAAPFTGTIAEGYYTLGSNDSMMTVVLRALEDEGFTWNGTVGEPGSGVDAADYGISYLASINKGGQLLGEFSGVATSGWMGTLNDWFVNESFAAFTVSSGKLESGDEIHIMFTMNLGADIGGTWGNSDTSLAELTVTGGTLTPDFDGATTEYTLKVPAKGAGVTVWPVAANKNYQSRIYLNSYNKDSALYKRTDRIAVQPGDVIYVGVGERGWPTMNSSGRGTKYVITVVADDSESNKDKDKDKDTNSSIGSASNPASVETKAEVVDGEAKAEVTAEDVKKAIEENGDASVVSVKVESEDAESVEATLDAEAVKAAADAGLGLNVETENGTVKVDAAAVKALAADGEEVSVAVRQNEDGSTTFEVTSGGETVDAKVKVELPATGEDQMLVIVGADGAETPVILSASEDGTVYAEIPAGATVKVVDAEGMEFDDVKADDWFAGAVDFVSSHGIFQGTGEGFEAGTTMNRAMLAMVLYRIDGATGGGSSTFADVKPEDWFADAVSWAADAGIVNGRGEGFAPDTPVTREEIATMLYRFVQYLGVDVRGSADLSAFPDGGETSGWAGDAMAWAVSVGLFQGDQNGALNPGGEATRAEVATLTERLVKLIVK